MENIKVLIVEDDMIIGADLSLNLSQRGYEVLGIIPRGESVLESIATEIPDLILMDVNLKGAWDGIDTAQKVQESYDIPLIFLTANSDSETFSRAKSLKPFAFLIKPYQPDDLERAMELAISRMEENATPSSTSPSPDKSTASDQDGFILKDRIFIKSKDRLVKVSVEDILYIEAESNYSKIVTREKDFLMALTLKAIEQRLNHPAFLRVHRSYIINLHKLDAVGEVYLSVGKQQIPISKSNREKLFQRLKMI